MTKAKWNLNKVKILAEECNSKTEFITKYCGAYKWAYKNNLLKEICSHMSKPQKKSIWNKTNILIEANKYSKRSDFRKKSNSAYNWARENNLLDIICSHMKLFTKYDYKSVKIIAEKYSNRGEFSKNDATAYRWARRNGVLNEICNHMEFIRNYWSLESVTAEAKKFTTRSSFNKDSPGAYEWAIREKVLDTVCSHMEIKGHKYKRALYAYEFENGSVYVGLTFDYNKRDLEHRRRGPVFKELKKSKAKLIKFSIWMNVKEAKLAEIDLIDKYRTEGWKLLNKAKGGSIGGNDIIWYSDILVEEAMKYKTIQEFREKSPSAYTTACKKGLAKIAPHLKYKRKYWNNKLVLQEAKKYSTRSDFKIKSAGAYDWAYSHGLLDKVCEHMTRVRKSWDYISVTCEAMKYKTRKDFQINAQSAYVWAQRNKLLNIVCSHMRRPVQDSKWDYEKVNNIAKKYKTKSEFKKNDSGVYQWARKYGLLDELCCHMKKK